MVDLRLLRRIAEQEFPDIVESTVIIRDKLLLHYSLTSRISTMVSIFEITSPNETSSDSMILSGSALGPWC